MQVIYTGGYPAVVLPLPDGDRVTVARGEAAEVPEEVGRSLLEQAENWQAAATNPPADNEKAGE